MTRPILSIKLRNERDVVGARQQSRRLSALLGFDPQEQTRIATAVSEIARNAFRYAGSGVVELRVDGVLKISVRDEGPGIADLEQVLQGRYKSATGMGLGITGARRLMDKFHIETAPGQGTAVTMEKRLPKRLPAPSDRELERIAGELAGEGEDPYQELDLQQRELIRTLHDLRIRQEELAQLNRELEDTNRGVVALYAELDEKAEYLRQADRLKSTFLSHMSHEFRTPLNSILALSRILLDRMDGPLTDEQEKQVVFIHNAVRELTEMVNDLLDLAKVEAGKIDVHLAEFDVAKLLGTVRGMMRPLCTNPNVLLTFDDVPAGTPAMCSDEAKVAQILRNFISNAIKFTEQGEIRVAFDYDAAAARVIFTVSDTGLGVAPEDQERIFEQYYQVDSLRQRKVKGTGLGLPLSRKLAELLRGSISMKSELGAGSQFELLLPLRLDTSPRPPRVLVIDDEELARYLVRRVLSELSPEVQEARDGAEGLRAAREHKPDVIVLDLAISGVTGFEVISLLEREPSTRDIPVVIHTSLSLGKEDRAALVHARAIVSKSRSDPDLRDAVRSLTLPAR